MGRDRKDGDLAGLRAVAPKDAVSARRSILGIRFPHALSCVVRIGDSAVLVTIEPRLPGILAQLLDGLVDLLVKAFGFRRFFRLHSPARFESSLRRSPQVIELLGGFEGPPGSEGHRAPQPILGNPKTQDLPHAPVYDKG